MREFSKEVVFKFDNAVKDAIPSDKLDTFVEVFHTINDLISNKKIYNSK